MYWKAGTFSLRVQQHRFFMLTVLVERRPLYLLVSLCYVFLFYPLVICDGRLLV